MGRWRISSWSAVDETWRLIHLVGAARLLASLNLSLAHG